LGADVANGKPLGGKGLAARFSPANSTVIAGSWQLKKLAVKEDGINSMGLKANGAAWII
jgi:hypothetical protein